MWTDLCMSLSLSSIQCIVITELKCNCFLCQLHVIVLRSICHLEFHLIFVRYMKNKSLAEVSDIALMSFVCLLMQMQ